MIKITSACDPSLVSPDLKCVQLIVKSVFEDKEIKDAEFSIIDTKAPFILGPRQQKRWTHACTLDLKETAFQRR